MSNENLKYCSKCNKEFEKLRYKEMCQICYNKIYRSSDIGKEKLRLYNNSDKAKETRKRYLEKNGLVKPPKPPKPNCVCGKISIAKGLCMNCYQKKRYELLGKKVNKYRKQNINDIYEKVLDLVKKGYTIENAIKYIRINRWEFYYLITPHQKKELISCKIIATAIKKNKINYEDDNDVI